jgi:Intracellular proteinase inhibitor
MSSRILIPFLCVGAVIFACGPRTNNEAATLEKDSVELAHSTPMLVAQQGEEIARSSSRDSSGVSADLYVRATGGEITFALNVVNNTKKNVELDFPTGQTHDFVVIDSVGREMWRWSEGRMFTQALRNKLLGRGESLEIAETMKRAKPLPAGRYTARALLTSRNYPITREAEFIVTSTTVAVR